MGAGDCRRHLDQRYKLALKRVGPACRKQSAWIRADDSEPARFCERRQQGVDDYRVELRSGTPTQLAVRTQPGGSAVGAVLTWASGRERRFIRTLARVLPLGDAVAVVGMSLAVGGPQSPLRYLLVLQAVEITLLASFRTGLKLVAWQSLVVSSLYADGPRKTLNVIEFFYPEEISAFEREFVEAQQAAYMETCVEDDQIALRMDAGRAALLARGDDEYGPYQSPMEDGMQQFHEWYRRAMDGAAK